jgi:L-ribulose-5-phosphate 3-epimerase UlaE
MNTQTSIINTLKKKYNVIDIVDLTNWNDNYQQSQQWLERKCQDLHREEYTSHERIVFLHSKDYYSSDGDIGYILKNLQVILNEVDISNAFAIVVSSNPDISHEIERINKISQDPVPVTVIVLAPPLVIADKVYGVVASKNTLGRLFIK